MKFIKKTSNKKTKIKNKNSNNSKKTKSKNLRELEEEQKKVNFSENLLSKFRNQKQ